MEGGSGFQVSYENTAQYEITLSWRNWYTRYTHDEQGQKNLRMAIPLCKNWTDLCRHLGLKGDSSRTIDVVKRRVTELHLDCSHFSWRRTFDKSKLEKLVPRVKSYRQLLVRMGMSPYGSAYPSIKKILSELRLDTSHFDRGKIS